MTRLWFRIWLAAGTALASLRGALWYDDARRCANQDCARRTHFLRRGPAGLLLCLTCAPPERGTTHDHF